MSAINRRLRRLEALFGSEMGDPRHLSDDRLDELLQVEYRALICEHGSMPEAIAALRDSGTPQNIELADLIEWDMAEQCA